VLTTGIDVWGAKEDEILKSCTRVYRRALEYENAIITYDAIGVGSSCGAKFNELGYFNKHKKFFAGGAVINPDKVIDKCSSLKNKDFYSNVKSQAWWSVAERLKNTYNAVNKGMTFKESEMLFIDSGCSHLEQLIEELSTPRKSFDAAGKVMVESKKDLKKRGIKSPNIADAYIMAHLEINKQSGLSF
jgi:phage terminase large subunit